MLSALLEHLPEPRLEGGSLQADGADVTIGNDLGGNHFDGQLDEVRIWDSALSAAEIAAEMTTLITGDEPGLVAGWRFNEPSGDMMFDASSVTIALFGLHCCSRVANIGRR